MKVSFKLFLLLVIFFQIGQVIYFNQGIFLERYDEIYWKDRLEHSQWHLPLSKRIVGDDGLFSHVGLNLIKGSDPSIFINPETPPLGKYLIGLSIIVFKNPAHYALILGIATLCLFYHFSKKLLKSDENALFLTALLSLDPLFFTQLTKAWVDLPQLFFLLINSIFFLKIKDKKLKKITLTVLLSGIALGFFTQSKPAILFPLILLLEAGFFIVNKLFKEVVIFLSGVAAGIIIVFIPYFSHGHSLIDFLKLQKYIIDFYTKSQLVIHNEAIWQTLFLGKFPDIASGSPINVAEWWVFWPLISFIGILTSIILVVKKSNVYLKGISIFVLSTLIIFTFIPSYPRYLLIVLPFLYLMSFYLIEKFVGRMRFLVIISILYGLFHATFFLLPKPDVLLSNFYYNFSNQYFQDVYQENIASKSKNDVSRKDFRLLTQGALDNATVKAIEIKEIKKRIPMFGNSGEADISVLYKTQDLGAFSEDKTLKLVKENEQWKVVWDWNILLTAYKPGLRIEAKVDYAKRGSIFNEAGNVLAEDSEGFLISVNPEKIDRGSEEQMLKIIGEVSYSKPIHLQNAYLENSIPGNSVPLATNFVPIDDTTISKVLSFPGVSLSPYPTRVYREIDPTSIKNLFYEECCTRIYSSYSYHGVEGFEKVNDLKLWGESGGEITLKSREGDIVRIIIIKKRRDGEDLFL